MKVAYITNSYNNEVIKVTCRSEEEYAYWKKVLSKIEDSLSVEMSFGDKDLHDLTEEEMEEWEIDEVAR